LTTPSQALKAIKGIKAGKAWSRSGIPKRVLRHLPMRAITFLTKLFNAVIRRQYFPPVWKHARVLPILKPWKDPIQPSSYRPVSLLDTVGKIFEKILLSRVLRAVNESGLLRDEQFAFRPKHRTTLQLARLVERVNRNFDERLLNGAVSLDVAKAFGTVWVKGLLYKLTVMNFPSYLVKTMSYLDCRTSTCLVMGAVVAQGGLVYPVLFSLYINDIPTPSRHFELAQYADDTALIATSRDPSLIVVGCEEAYLGRLELWLRNWKIATLLFTKVARSVRQPRPLQNFGEPIEWVQRAR
jgi:hypothetical protein